MDETIYSQFEAGGDNFGEMDDSSCVGLGPISHAYVDTPQSTQHPAIFSPIVPGLSEADYIYASPTTSTIPSVMHPSMRPSASIAPFSPSRSAPLRKAMHFRSPQADMDDSSATAYHNISLTKNAPLTPIAPPRFGEDADISIDITPTHRLEDVCLGSHEITSLPHVAYLPSESSRKSLHNPANLSFLSSTSATTVQEAESKQIRDALLQMELLDLKERVNRSHDALSVVRQKEKERRQCLLDLQEDIAQLEKVLSQSFIVEEEDAFVAMLHDDGEHISSPTPRVLQQFVEQYDESAVMLDVSALSSGSENDLQNVVVRSEETLEDLHEHIPPGSRNTTHDAIEVLDKVDTLDDIHMRANLASSHRSLEISTDSISKVLCTDVHAVYEVRNLTPPCVSPRPPSPLSVAGDDNEQDVSIVSDADTSSFLRGYRSISSNQSFMEGQHSPIRGRRITAKRVASVPSPSKLNAATIQSEPSSTTAADALPLSDAAKKFLRQHTITQYIPSLAPNAPRALLLSHKKRITAKLLPAIKRLSPFATKQKCDELANELSDHILNLAMHPHSQGVPSEVPSRRPIKNVTLSSAPPNAKANLSEQVIIRPKDLKVPSPQKATHNGAQGSLEPRPKISLQTLLGGNNHKETELPKSASQSRSGLSSSSSPSRPGSVRTFREELVYPPSRNMNAISSSRLKAPNTLNDSSLGQGSDLFVPISSLGYSDMEGVGLSPDARDLEEAEGEFLDGVLSLE